VNVLGGLANLKRKTAKVFLPGGYKTCVVSGRIVRYSPQKVQVIAMQYRDPQSAIQLELCANNVEIAADQRARMQSGIDRVADELKGLASKLWVTIHNHPKNPAPYHVKAKLRLPQETFKTSDWDSYLDAAFQRCITKLIRKIEWSRERADISIPTERPATLPGTEVAAPEDPQDSVLAWAVAANDYRVFRQALSGHEEWLRDRVGRWVQRFPVVDLEIDKGVTIADLVEEVYLNAFDRFAERIKGQSTAAWLNDLIDPSVKMFVRHPDEEQENVRAAEAWVEATPAARYAPSGRPV
jgi:hypothetical protein